MNFRKELSALLVAAFATAFIASGTAFALGLISYADEIAAVAFYSAAVATIVGSVPSNSNKNDETYAMNDGSGAKLLRRFRPARIRRTIALMVVLLLVSNSLTYYYTRSQIGEITADRNAPSRPSQDSLPKGVLTHYASDLSGASRTLRDESGNGHAGQLIGGVAFDSKPNCQFGSCLRFDGKTGYVTADAPLNFTKPYSISAWIETSPINETRQAFVLSEFDGGPSTFSLGVEGYKDGPHLFLCYFDGENNQCNTPGDILTTNTWYFVVGSWTGTALQLYVNGVLIGITATTSTPQTTSLPVFIGARGHFPVDDFFSGRIDEIGIYDHALSYQEVLLLYNGA